jgi:beta-phosphoglucomutase-like phosphatase (HAD superfamily)
MNKAFIFDMDGVLINSERAWGDEEHVLLEDMFGKPIAEAVSDTIGVSIQTTYQKARDLGATISYQECMDRYFEGALKVLARAEITLGADVLVERLSALGFKLALVSSSPQRWIDQVLPKLSFADKFEYIESLFEHPELKPKPEPDGYLEALRRLSAEPKGSVILEDSNPGITAGKAAGAYTIGFRENLVHGYQQTGADAYADKMDDVIALVEKFIQQ